MKHIPILCITNTHRTLSSRRSYRVSQTTQCHQNLLLICVEEGIWPLSWCPMTSTMSSLRHSNCTLQPSPCLYRHRVANYFTSSARLRHPEVGRTRRILPYLHVLPMTQETHTGYRPRLPKPIKQLHTWAASAKRSNPTLAEAWWRSLWRVNYSWGSALPKKGRKEWGQVKGSYQ